MKQCLQCSADICQHTDEVVRLLHESNQQHFAELKLVRRELALYRTGVENLGEQLRKKDERIKQAEEILHSVQYLSHPISLKAFEYFKP